MGEAQRRRAAGLPPKSVHCPVISCRSRQVMLHPKTSAISAMLARMWGGVEPTDHYRCLSCNALWEALPAGWNSDAVERSVSMGPCDNCAYRATSPETRDPEKREWLHDRANADDPYSAIMSPFCCHKGVPLKLTVDPPSIEYDFAAAGIDPRDQTCAGFLRLLWAKNGANKERRERRAADGTDA